MVRLLIRLLGLKGSWKWACEQMEKGYMVRRKTDTGTCKYRLDREHQRRIEYTWALDPQPGDWVSAYIFFYDFEYTEWEIFKAAP